MILRYNLPHQLLTINWQEYHKNYNDFLVNFHQENLNYFLNKIQLFPLELCGDQRQETRTSLRLEEPWVGWLKLVEARAGT